MQIARKLLEFVPVNRHRSIRGGMGLGDALYVQGVARYFVERGQKLEICSKWPEVFSQIGDMVRVVPFRRDRIDILAHYSLRKPRTDTNQWQDCCVQAGIQEHYDLRLDWDSKHPADWNGKPYVCLSMPRIPMDRKDGIGMSLLPDFRAIQRVIDVLRERYTVIQIGAGVSIHQFTGVELDLSNQTSVSQMLDIAKHAAGFIGYCSFIVPLAESFNRPLLAVWSAKGLKDRYPYVRQITAQKILSKPSSHWIMDSSTDEDIDAAASAFLPA